MARTKGSGWGGGTLLYQKCPECGKKKAIFDPLEDLPPFRCTICWHRFYSETHYRLRYRSQYDRLLDNDIPTVRSESIETFEKRSGHSFWGSAAHGYIYDKDNN